MLTITDLGCERHNRRQFTLSGVEADILGDILFNLPSDGDFHTFVCEHGHTHRLTFNVQVEKLYRLSAMFSRKRKAPVRQKLQPGHANRGQHLNLVKG